MLRSAALRALRTTLATPTRCAVQIRGGMQPRSALPITSIRVAASSSLLRRPLSRSAASSSAPASDAAPASASDPAPVAASGSLEATRVALAVAQSRLASVEHVLSDLKQWKAEVAPIVDCPHTEQIRINTYSRDGHDVSLLFQPDPAQPLQGLHHSGYLPDFGTIGRGDGATFRICIACHRVVDLPHWSAQQWKRVIWAEKYGDKSDHTDDEREEKRKEEEERREMDALFSHYREQQRQFASAASASSLPAAQATATGAPSEAVDSNTGGEKH